MILKYATFKHWLRYRKESGILSFPNDNAISSVNGGKWKKTMQCSTLNHVFNYQDPSPAVESHVNNHS